MWPTKNALMRVGKGRDKNIITPGTIMWECVLACPHFFLTAWPQLSWLTVYFGPSPWVNCCCLLDWHKPETRNLNLITETIIIVTQSDPDLYSNGLIYLVSWRCIFWGLGVKPRDLPATQSLFLSITALRQCTQLPHGFPFCIHSNWSIWSTSRVSIRTLSNQFIILEE